jgi:hypothetical protein
VGDNYFKPRHKWQIVDQVYAMEEGRYSKKTISRKTMHELYGWRFRLVTTLREKEKTLRDYRREWYIDEDSFVESMKPNA